MYDPLVQRPLTFDFATSLIAAVIYGEIAFCALLIIACRVDTRDVIRSFCLSEPVLLSVIDSSTAGGDCDLFFTEQVKSGVCVCVCV